MTPEQFQIFLKSNEEATGRAIEKYVNGHLREMKHDLENHAKDDKTFQDRAEPMLKVFENNNIVRMTLKKDTKEIVFWISSASVFAGAIWWFINKFGIIFFTKP